MAKTIQEEQLKFLAKELSLVESQLQKLLKRKELLRSKSFELIIEGNLNSCSTEHGKFIRCKGKTVKIFTCPKVRKAETTLKNAKLRATENNLFEEKKGEDFLRFDAIQLD